MNSSIYAILLSSAFAFCLIFLASLWAKKDLDVLLNVIAVALSTIIIYFNFQGRAALIGTSASIVYLLASSNLIRKKNFLLTILFGLMFLQIGFFYFVKKDSSKGRLLIYKVVFTQLKPKNYVKGLGIGKFKATYNKLQASYFEQSNLKSKEALLAGNGYYLFNDWLQFILEIGIIGFLIILVFLFFFFSFFSWTPKDKPIVVAANATLICIGTAALFSYPLQVQATLVFFSICLCIHLYYSWRVKEKYNKKNFRICLRIASISVFLLGLSYSVLLYLYNKDAKLAFELNRDGFKKEAEKLFQKLDKYPVNDYNTYYNYAFLLFYKNELSKALEQIDKSLNLAYSVTSVKLKADILFEMGKPKEAEYFYKQAVYIIPGRMAPKFSLLQFYIKTKQTENIKFWAKEILEMPVKIPSETTASFQDQAKEILKKYFP